MIECKLCKELFESQIYFSSHLRKTHQIKYKDYYDQFLRQATDGICKTCGKLTKFERGKYRDFCCVSCMRRNPEVQAKTRQTSIERYGGVGLDSAKIKEKAKQTCLDKYNVSNPFQIIQVKNNAHSEEAKQKCKKTMLSRYGVDNPAKLNKNKRKFAEITHTVEVNQKRIKSTKASNLAKYGVEYNFQRQDVKDSIKQTFVEKYGVEYPKQYEEFKNKDRLIKLNNSIQFCLENDRTPVTEIIAKYGTGWYQSGLFIDAIIKHNAVSYVKNNYIESIKNYKPIKSINRFSIFEKEVYDYVSSIYDKEIRHNDRSVIKPLELDLYLPEAHVAIECSGIYWHSTNNIIDKNYHMNKTDLCINKNIRLIHIFENEWITSQEICKSIIASALDIYQTKIYAKDCKIREVDKTKEKTFLTINHINGYVLSKYRFGLFCKNELVQLITIDKHKKNEYELLRVCTKLNTQVIGGLSKLMQHQPFSIIYSYIDRSKFSDIDYYNTNFTFESFTGPSYFYWSSITGKVNKSDCTKYKLSKILGHKFDVDKTIQQNMLDNGFYQIYDSGRIKVVYNRT